MQVISEISVLLRGLVACAATVMEEEQQNLQAALLEESKKAMHKLANRLTVRSPEHAVPCSCRPARGVHGQNRALLQIYNVDEIDPWGSCFRARRGDIIQ